MADSKHWSAVKRWLEEDRLALVVIVFAVGLQVVIAMRMFVPGELAGDDMSIHLAEIAGIARSLSSGELDLWNPGANAGFASGYFYQFLPQLACAVLYLFFGWLVSLVTLFKVTVLAALIATPLTVYRAMRVCGATPIVAAAAGLGASTVFATSGWGAGIDSLFSAGLYTQAFALVFYPLALAHAARYLIDGKGFGRAIIYTLLTGFCHPFIAFAIAPPLLFVPWWNIGLKNAAIRCASLFFAALFGSSPLWLPILVDYDAFGGFPARVSGEEGIAANIFVSELKRGAYLDVSRRAVSTALVFAGLPVLLLRSGRVLAPLYLSGFTFAAFIMLGPVVGKTEGDLLPAVRFLAPMQMFLGAVGWAALAVAVKELVSMARPRLKRRARLAGGSALALIVVFLVVELGAGVAVRSKVRVRTVHAFKKIRRAELGKIIAFLETQPPGRVLSASEFGSGSHWWMYLPYVYVEKPAVRAYGGAALQSSPNFVFLRKLDVFRHHATFATRYLVARTSVADGKTYGERFAALEATIIYEEGGYRIYELDDSAMMRAVGAAGSLTGDRKAKTARILEWMKSSDWAVNRALVEGDPIGEVAAPEAVTFLERRNSRRSHGARVRVDAERSALVSLAATFHPGWRVTIDGVEAKARRVSPAFVAVLVPPGEHEVRFTFVRPAWTWLLYLLMVIAMGGYVLRQRWVRKRVAQTAAALLLLASTSAANAQPDSYPKPVDAAFGKEGRGIVATTAGLLLRKREGEAFAYVCPLTSGSKAGAFSPRVAIRANGTFVATSYAGLRESRDGCEFERLSVFDEGNHRIKKDLWFSDVEVAPPDKLWAVTADSHSGNDVYFSETARHALNSAKLSSDRFWYVSIVATPDGSRTYASGYMVAGRQESEILKLLIVDDQVASAFGLEAGPSGRLRVALAPTADEVYVVAEAALEPRGDVLYFSRDAAKNFEEVFGSPAAIVGMVRDQSGATWIATESELLRKLDDQGEFVRVLSASLSCLVLDSTGALIACRADTASSGELLSRVVIAPNEVSLVSYLRASDVGAPCSRDCGVAWQRVCATYAADCTANAAEPLEAPELEGVERAQTRRYKATILIALIFMIGVIGVAFLLVRKS